MGSDSEIRSGGILGKALTCQTTPRDMPSGDAGSGIASTAMCATSAQAPTQRQSARQLRTQTDSRHRLGRAPSARENGCRAALTKAGVAAVLAAASSGQAIDVYQ